MQVPVELMQTNAAAILFVIARLDQALDAAEHRTGLMQCSTLGTPTA
jgi:hypothetical protein